MSNLSRLVGRDLRGRLAADARALPAPGGPSGPVSEDDLADLPDVVRRYLGFMGVVGRPRVRSFRTRLRGRFRMRPGQRFMPAEIWQYDTVVPIARLYWMRIDFVGFVPMVGRDSYADGRGRMLGKLLDTFVVADGEGEEFDIGELTTWLNDAVLIAPSMLLDAGATFHAVDHESFEVTLADAGRTVTARVEVDDRGAPVTFVTHDRYADLPGGLVRATWSTPVHGWQIVDGLAQPSAASAVWHLAEGDFTYAEFEFRSGDFEANCVGGTVVADVAVADVADADVSVADVAVADVADADVSVADVADADVGRAEAVGRRARRRPTARSGFADTIEGALRIVGSLLGAPLLRAGYNRWGATDEECGAAMPGDDLVPMPVLESTRAIRVEAPRAAVWPWLVQIGHGRGGLYSYDALENLAGCDLHSADAVLPEHQHLAAGDLVRLGPAGYPCFAVVSVDPGRSLVLVGADPRSEQAVATPVEPGGVGATWQWQLRAEGGRTTRLVSRQRNTHPRSQRRMWRIVEPVGFVMERRMLLGIRDRAERSGV